MGTETVQIWSGNAAEASFYRVAHLLASALWDRGAGDRALGVLTNLFAEVTHGSGGAGSAVSVGVGVGVGGGNTGSDLTKPGSV